MNKQMLRTFASLSFSVTLAVSLALLSAVRVSAQCNELVSGLRIPLGITQSNLDNLLVSETGTGSLHTGRISIIDTSGNRRTLLDGLPSAINDVNEPSGPAGLFMRGRTLYVAMGIGNAIQAGPFPGTATGNPNPSSPIFSSVLAIHFSASAEQTTSGFALTLADQTALGNAQKVTLADSIGNKLTIELIADFPNHTANPLPTFALNVRGSNPFDLTVVEDQVYVTDGGQNMVRQVDIPTGTFTTLATFAPIPNPFFPAIGGPVIEAVPTGIRFVDDQLLVALFKGVPFPPGVSQIQAVDPVTGAQTPFITGRKTAIDTLSIKDGDDTDYLVLQHASVGLFFGGPGLVLRFETPGDAPILVANCLTRPSSMTLDQKSSTLYVTELGGRVVAIPIP
jgi:hypothetical protein